jgi:hypothetical protein
MSLVDVLTHYGVKKMTAKVYVQCFFKIKFLRRRKITAFFVYVYNGSAKVVNISLFIIKIHTIISTSTSWMKLSHCSGSEQ